MTASLGKPLLVDFSYNKYSQFGEDGIIDKLFSVIGTSSKICIEFGAWDGFHLANTANLWTKDWRGILIEGDTRRFRELTANTSKYACTCINAFVTRDGSTSLECLLETAGVRGAVDLLSIDIDGDDYYIFDGLVRLRPRVVVCEYNPTIPANIDLQANPGSNLGSSVAALRRLACEKGYELVALTQTNCFFVLREEVAKLEGFEMGFERLRRDDYLTYLITSYSGDYLISGPTPPYGLNFPYRGAISGPHQKVAVRCVMLRWWFDVVRLVKRIVKSVLGRS